MITRTTGIGEYGRTWLLDHPEKKARPMSKKKTAKKIGKKRARKRPKMKKPAKKRARKATPKPTRPHSHILDNIGIDVSFELLATELEYMTKQLAAAGALGLRIAELVGVNQDPIIRASVELLSRKEGAAGRLEALIQRHMHPPKETNA